LKRENLDAFPNTSKRFLKALALKPIDEAWDIFNTEIEIVVIHLFSVSSYISDSENIHKVYVGVETIGVVSLKKLSFHIAKTAGTASKRNKVVIVCKSIDIHADNVTLSPFVS